MPPIRFVRPSPASPARPAAAASAAASPAAAATAATVAPAPPLWPGLPPLLLAFAFAGTRISAGGRGRGRIRTACSPAGRLVAALLLLLRVLLHVLGQVGLLRVRLAAQLADVRLQVLGVLVLRDVLEQRGLVGEALVARVALERLVRLMAPRVGLQVGELRERLRAAGMPALVRLVAGVRPDVLLQVRQLRELALADLAPVRLDAEMYPRVLRQTDLW
uniref:Uncharacterized protein n=1 Tax=Anopheles atroparvus TaxID=41427 RepID=A0A182J195_ANOAO